MIFVKQSFFRIKSVKILTPLSQPWPPDRVDSEAKSYIFGHPFCATIPGLFRHPLPCGRQSRATPRVRPFLPRKSCDTVFSAFFSSESHTPHPGTTPRTPTSGRGAICRPDTVDSGRPPPRRSADQALPDKAGRNGMKGGCLEKSPFLSIHPPGRTSPAK